MIVHDVSKVVGRQFIGRFIKNLIIQNRWVDNHFTTDQVVHTNIFVRFNLETDYILLAFRNQCIHFFLRHSQWITHHPSGRCVILEVSNFRTLGVQFLRGIKGDVCFSILQQNLYIFLIDFAAFRLTVRAMFPTEAHTFVKVDTQPLERFEYILFRSRNKPVRISILNTKY